MKSEFINWLQNEIQEKRKSIKNLNDKKSKLIDGHLRVEAIIQQYKIEIKACKIVRDLLNG